MAQGDEDIYFDAAVCACVRACDAAGGKDLQLDQSPCANSSLNVLAVSCAARAVGMSRGEVSGEGHTEETLPVRKQSMRRVSFDLAATQIYEVTPYREVFGVLPYKVNFDKFDQTPVCSFIADPDAADVDSDTEPDSDGESEANEDEGPQPILTRRGFIRPSVTLDYPTALGFDDYDCRSVLRQHAKVFPPKHEEDDDDIGTQEPSSRESSTHDFSSDGSIGEDGLPDSPTDWCGHIPAESQTRFTVHRSFPHQGQDEDALMDQNGPVVPKESHGMVVSRRGMPLGDDSVVQQRAGNSLQKVDSLSQTCVASLGEIAVMLCSMPAIIARKFSNALAKRVDC